MIHNGIYTVSHNGTGEHATFKIASPNRRSRLYGKRIVSYLSGPDNRADYTGFAFLTDGQITPWRRFTDSPLVVIARQIINPTGEWAIQCARRCMVCNRLLTTPVSIECGIGPICADRENLYVPAKVRKLIGLQLQLEAAT